MGGKNRLVMYNRLIKGCENPFITVILRFILVDTFVYSTQPAGGLGMKKMVAIVMCKKWIGVLQWC